MQHEPANALFLLYLSYNRGIYAYMSFISCVYIWAWYATHTFELYLIGRWWSIGGGAARYATHTLICYTYIRAVHNIPSMQLMRSSVYVCACLYIYIYVLFILCLYLCIYVICMSYIYIYDIYIYYFMYVCMYIHTDIYMYE